MLPASYQPTDYRFRIDDRNGIKRLLMVTVAMEEQAKSRPMEPLWWREMGDDRTLNAVVNWLRLRRQSWQEWGDMATGQGREVLAEHLQSLLEQEPPVEVTGMLIEASEDEHQLSLGDLAVTPSGLSKRVYYTHTFADPQRRKAFHEWLLANNPEGNGNAMLDMALDSGTAKLAVLMDEIAAEELLKIRQTAS